MLEKFNDAVKVETRANWEYVIVKPYIAMTWVWATGWGNTWESTWGNTAITLLSVSSYIFCESSSALLELQALDFQWMVIQQKVNCSQLENKTKLNKKKVIMKITFSTGYLMLLQQFIDDCVGYGQRSQYRRLLQPLTFLLPELLFEYWS